MTTVIIITFCSLLLLAYLFDITSSKSKIPAVILLLLLGWLVRQLTHLFNIQLPDFTPALPILGTIGLILIVLESSLELELNKSKTWLIAKSFFGALLPMLLLAVSLGYSFHYFGQFSLKDSLLNAIPFCIISSAIAIPSVRNLPIMDREFIIYESSFSEIFGVSFFTFISLNEIFGIISFGQFGLELLIMLLISLIATVGLSFLLSKIKHHIKLFPIIMLVILIYEVSKIFHLPGLIFILLFGLFLRNFDKLKRFKPIEKFQTDILEKEVTRFKELTIEATFLVRSLFFLLFGYLIETSEIFNAGTSIWAIGIVALIFALRIIQLKLSGIALMPLLFVAPRGLITILLFFSIEPLQLIPLVNKSLIIQVIVLTAFAMMIGFMFTDKKEKENYQP